MDAAAAYLLRLVLELLRLRGEINKEAGARARHDDCI